MELSRWIEKNTAHLDGKLIAVTGSTGGLGLELCRHLATLGARLLLINRNPARAEHQRQALLSDFPSLSVESLAADMEDADSVRALTERLKNYPLDALILNAGAYSIPRKTCSTGYDNVFQINFVSPYYMVRELMPLLRERSACVVAVGSIAHNYSKIDPRDVDFSTYAAASKVYGNAKRHLMYALSELFRGEDSARLAIVHPGITFTNITSHYPPLIFAIIKHPMKVIFMPPKKAALCILSGLFDATAPSHWIGPRLFDVWGLPKKKSLRTASPTEISEIANRAQVAFEKMQ